MPGWQADSLRVAIEMESGSGSFDAAKGTFEEIRQYLAKAGAKVPGELPGGLARSESLGCKRIRVGEHAGVVICFMLDSGKEAHLVVVDSGDLPGLPPAGEADYRSEKGWNLATWTDGAQSYVLATTDDVAALKKIVGRV